MCGFDSSYKSVVFVVCCNLRKVKNVVFDKTLFKALLMLFCVAQLIRFFVQRSRENHHGASHNGGISLENVRASAKYFEVLRWFIVEHIRVCGSPAQTGIQQHNAMSVSN